MSEPREPYPVTIVPARYGGIYEPGAWLAFPTHNGHLPTGWDAGDVDCMDFWHTTTEMFGAGDSPQAAYDDLRRKMAERGGHRAG